MKPTRKFIAAALSAATLLACGTAGAATYAKKLDITAAGVPENVTLTDFPLLVRLSESIDGFSYQDFLGTGGSDIRFEDASGNPLAYDVDTWNELGESLIWVKVPSLQKDSVVTMQFGSTAPDANDPTDTWSNYAGVWHGNADATDSTTNEWAATCENTVKPDGGFSMSTVKSEHLGSAWFNSDNAKGLEIILGPATIDNPLSKLDSVSKFAASAWVHLSANVTKPDFRLFSSKGEAAQDGFELMPIASQNAIMLRGNSNKKTVSWAGGTGTSGYKAFAETSGSRWFHMACVFDSDADDSSNGKIFINGDSLAGAIDAPKSTGKGLTVGGYGGPLNTKIVYAPILGYVDEIRIYNGVPSDEYLQAEHAQVVTSGYVTYGTVQNAATDTPDISAGPAVVRNQDGTYTVTATIGGVAGNAYDLVVQFGSTTLWSTTWTATAGADTYALSFTSAGTEAAGTYAASVVATAPSGASARRTSDEIFLVGDIAAAKGADANEEGLVAGSFVLSRPGDVTLPLTVAYDVSSATATAGVSFQAPSGTATFAAGESTVSVPITPLNDVALKADATLTLSVLAGSGLYGGVGATASLTLVDYAVPAGYNAWVATYDGNASSDANWSLGRAPVATDKILLGAWSSRNLTWDALATRSVTSWTQTTDYNGLVTFPITYEGADVDAGFNLFTVSGDVSVLGGAWVHPVQGDSSKTSTEPVERYWLNVAVGGDFTVGTGVNISAQGRGRGFWVYNTNKGWSGRGVYGGYVVMDTNTMYSAEADEAFIPYGSILEPLDTGKGITSQTDSAIDIGHGGGAIHIVVSGDFVNEGRVIANGQTSTGTTGGSGGSIYVRASNILGDGSFEAKASNLTSAGAKAAGSGGRISLVAIGSNAATSSTASAAGGRSFGWWQRENLIQEGAAGTVWLQSGADKTLLVRNVVDNWTDGAYHDLGPYVRAYTPIPAADDAATFKAATANAELYAESNARIRLLANQRFATLKVLTESKSLAHVDLCGKTLRVEQVVDSADNPIVIDSGTYTLADALANGWTWFEDSSATLNEEGTAVATPGTGKIVIGESPTLMVFR